MTTTAWKRHLLVGSGLVLIATLSDVVQAANPELLLFGGTSHRDFLGCVNCSATEIDSIWNRVGVYGSKIGSNSIWNGVGTYGNKFSPLSPWNKFSTNASICKSFSWKNLRLNKSTRWKRTTYQLRSLRGPAVGKPSF